MTVWSLKVVGKKRDETFAFLEKPEFESFERHMTWKGKNTRSQYVEIRVGLDKLTVLTETKA